MPQQRPASDLDPLDSSADSGGRAAIQTAFYDLRDPLWVAFLLRRLAAGDVVRVDRCGDLVIMDGVDKGSRLDT